MIIIFKIGINLAILHHINHSHTMIQHIMIENLLSYKVVIMIKLQSSVTNYFNIKVLGVTEAHIILVIIILTFLEILQNLDLVYVLITIDCFGIDVNYLLTLFVYENNLLE